MSKIFFSLVAVLLVVALGAAAVYGLNSRHSGRSTNAVGAPASSAPNTAVAQSPASPTSNNTAAPSAPRAATAPTGVQDVADLYDSLRPSVVRVNGASTRSGSGGTGSGVVLDKQGNILTNYHVVNGFNQLDVKLADGTDVPATVVGTDPGDDLAVVKVSVSADKLTPAKLGDSDKVRIGQPVITIGNPFELEGTLTEGVVSGMGRVLSGGNARPLRQLIQTDAAINPGNSGGGLFNLQGELIGITNALENPSGETVFIGIGYAIPVNTVKQFEPAMASGKPVSHPRLGISLQDVTPALATALNLPVQQGVLVGQVDANSGAAKAGLRGSTGGAGARATQGGDVIVGIDGKDVKAYDDLANYLDSKNAGDKVDLKVMRDGKSTTLTVTLDAWTVG